MCCACDLVPLVSFTTFQADMCGIPSCWEQKKNGGMRFGSDRVQLPLKESITAATRSSRCSQEVVAATFGRHRRLERRSALEALVAQVYLSRESEIPTTLYTQQPWSVSTVLLWQNPSFSAFPCNGFVSGFR